MFPAEDVWWKA